ncbi:MAG: alpha/beta hydrolase [Gammaproteobacteria bacterium]|nr:alpha/beta hydrolase [Gammaproteobacteria bacterium]
MQSEIKYVRANGLRFGYFEQGIGPLIILLHGFPDTPHTWNFVQPQLAQAGYRVVAPFMRGYPPSDISANKDYGVLALGQDIVALIEALGEKQAIVIGHDWGAFAAYAAANLSPQSIRKLVVVAIPHPGALRFNLQTLIKTHHFLTFQFRSWAVKRLRRDNMSEINAIYRRWSPNWQVSELELAPVKETLRMPKALEGALGYYLSFRREAIGRKGAATRQLIRQQTSTPTLAFFGVEDGALDQSSISRTRSCYSGPYEVVRVPKVGHFLHREIPEEFVRRVLAFIQ